MYTYIYKIVVKTDFKYMYFLKHLFLYCENVYLFSCAFLKYSIHHFKKGFIVNSHCPWYWVINEHVHTFCTLSALLYSHYCAIPYCYWTGRYRLWPNKWNSSVSLCLMDAIARFNQFKAAIVVSDTAHVV